MYPPVSVLSLLVVLRPSIGAPGVLGVSVGPGSISIVGNISRQHGGDVFSAIGSTCDSDTCVGLSSGTATLAPVLPVGVTTAANMWAASWTTQGDCTCKCHDHLPAFREDLNICVDDIRECSLAPFVSGSSSQMIPFVFLPLRGQIIHPSKEISFADVRTPICAVSGAQFLTRNGWVELRNPLDNDVPFRLFRDEGRTFLQWLGESELRSRMEGRLILVHMICRDVALAVESPATAQQIFTPCVAFRVVGSPAKHITNVSEVVFSPDAHLSDESTSGGLGVYEYVAIGVCSVLLGLIYVASVFLYLHLRRRRRKRSREKQKERDRRGEVVSSMHMVSSEEGVIKSNPLMGLQRHFIGPSEGRVDGHSGGFLSDSTSSPSDGELHHEEIRMDSVRNHSVQVTSAIVHPTSSSPQNMKDIQECTPSEMSSGSGIECLPEENVSIVEELEGREERPDTVKAIVNGTARRKLYFNPAYFEPQLLLAPPPAAIEFLTKIREVIAIAKHKMESKRYVPSLMGIPEEDPSHNLDMFDFLHNRAGSRRSSAVSLKRENSRRRNACTGCPGCEGQNLQELYGKLPEYPAILACQTCSTPGESKQRSIRKWLEDVPVMKNLQEDIIHESSNALAKSLMALTTEGKALGRGKVFNFQKNIDRSSSPFNHIIKSPINRIKSTEMERSRTPSPSSTLNKRVRVPDSISPDKLQHRNDNYDVVRGVRPVMPDMINEAMAMDGLKSKMDNPKTRMDAVINEFEENKQNYSRTPPLEYEADSLEREGKTKGRGTPPDYTDLSSQSSPSLSTALPMDEELTMRNAIYDVKTGTKIDKTLPTDLKKNVENRRAIYEQFNLEHMKNTYNNASSSIHGSNASTKSLCESRDGSIITSGGKRFTLPELLQRNEEYSLVSEVYVNNGYNFGSTPTSPSGSDSSLGSRKISKIKYDNPGHLTIEVEDSPENYIKVNESDFEPDTLDRKPSKMKLTLQKTEVRNESDSLERTAQIKLRTTGSFKSESLTYASDIGDILNRGNLNRNFGSLREIYEARNKNFPRPSLDNINFMGSTQSLNRSEDGALTWKRGLSMKDYDEGRILTLEARHSKRQRRVNEKNLRSSPPDVVLPATCMESPLYQRPKPPRKVQKGPPPLPPKNGTRIVTNPGKNSMKINSENSPQSTISFDTTSMPSLDSINSLQKNQNDRNILRNFILSNGHDGNHFNNQFIFQAEMDPVPKLKDPLKTSNFDDDLRSASMQIALGIHGRGTKTEKDKNADVKKTWRKFVELASHKFQNKPDDSGYLSTDSNDSNYKSKIQQSSVSETDESTYDGHSESGAESIETHSVFFGNFRKMPIAAGSIDSGVGSDFIHPEILIRDNDETDSGSDGDMNNSVVTVLPPRSATSTMSGRSRVS